MKYVPYSHFCGIGGFGYGQKQSNFKCLSMVGHCIIMDPPALNVICMTIYKEILAGVFVTMIIGDHKGTVTPIGHMINIFGKKCPEAIPVPYMDDIEYKNSKVLS